MAESDLRSKLRRDLRKALDEGRAVAVHANRGEPGQYEVAFVGAVSDDQVTLRCLTPRGEPDGLATVRLDDVFRVDVDSGYCRRLELLYQYRDTIYSEEPSESPGAIEETLRNAMESNSIVHVLDYADYGPIGFVEEVGHDFVTLRRVSANGEADGRATIAFDAVASVHVDRRSDQVVAFLYRYNNDLRKLLES